MVFGKPIGQFVLAERLENSLEIARIYGLPYTQQDKAILKTAEKHSQRLWSWSTYSYPRFSQMQVKALAAVVQCRMVRAGVESRLFHRAYQDWPKTVLELPGWSNGAYQDPYTDGEDFKIIPYGLGILIYCNDPFSTTPDDLSRIQKDMDFWTVYGLAVKK
jgi:hypothetical protein